MAQQVKTKISGIIQATNPQSAVHGKRPMRNWLQLRPGTSMADAFRWSALLLAIFLVLTIGCSSLSEWRNTRANDVTAELLPGRSVGQTFAARYSNLCGIEVQFKRSDSDLLTSPSVVLHLRQSPEAVTDIATVHVAAGDIKGNDPWYLFSFPAIPDSESKQYYFQVESPASTSSNALALSWWYASVPSDPYADGTGYDLGIPQRGDLAFGLRYAPSPLDIWGRVLLAISANFPIPLMFFIGLAIFAALMWALLKLPGILTNPHRRLKWLTRWSLPVVLGIVSLNGLTYLFLIPPWQGPDEHGHFAYVALMDKYDLDAGRVESFQWWEGGKDYGQALALKTAILNSMADNNWTRLFAGHPNPGAASSRDMETTLFWELRQPPTYYWLCAAAIRAARAAGMHLDVYAEPATVLRFVRGVSLLFSLGVVALAWLAGVLLGRNKHPWLRLLLPLTLGLLPMYSFISTMVNNDVLAELTVSALFVALVALLRWPTGLRGASLAVLMVGLTLWSIPTKSTALAAGLPLVGLGLLVWAGMLASRVARRRLNSQRYKARARVQRRPVGALLVLSGLLLAIAAIVALVAFEPQNAAAGWQKTGQPGQRVERLWSDSAHDGFYVEEVQPLTSTFQWVILPTPHPPLTVTFSAWARLAQPMKGQAAGVAVAQIIMFGDSRPVGEANLDPTGAWTYLTVALPVSESTNRLLLWLRAGDRVTQFDEMSFSVSNPERLSPEQMAQINHSLFNPSAEIGSLQLRPWLAHLFPAEPRQMLDVLVNRQYFDKVSLWQIYASGQYRTFWGVFGWVSLPLPEFLYDVLGVLTWLALAGLVWSGVRRYRRWTAYEWLGAISLLSLIVATLIGFTRQMAPIPLVGAYSAPQGRYLYVLIIPVVWLLLAGLWEVWSVLSAQVRPTLEASSLRSRFPGLDPARVRNEMVPWGVWALGNSLFLFTMFCLLCLIVPYYYGG